MSVLPGTLIERGVNVAFVWIGGFLVAAAVMGFLLEFFRRRQVRVIVNELRSQSQKEREEAVNAALAQVSQANTGHLDAVTKLGAAQLGSERTVIQQALSQFGEFITGEMRRLNDSLHSSEKQRTEQYTQFATQLAAQGEYIATLNQTTQSLTEALANTKTRGQWGERMAEDVLRHTGFVEGINYRKQRAIEGGGIPDYVFFMPDNQVLYMDVKFPFDNYLRYLESDSDMERKRYRDDFVGDVRTRVRGLAKREYIDKSVNSVDVLVMFIPNDSVFAFLHEQAPEVFDEAMQSRVICCSPGTLFGVLAVVRQSCDNFRMERASKEIVERLHGIQKQWGKFVDQTQKVETKLDALNKEFTTLVGTRKNELEKQFLKVEELRSRELELVEEDEGEADVADEDPNTLALGS